MYIIYCNNFIYIYMCMYTYRDTHTHARELGSLP